MNKALLIKELSDETKVSKDFANRIVNALYKKGLDAKDFDRVWWRLKRKVENEDLVKVLEKQTPKVIEGIVDEIIASRLPYDACCSEAFFFTELALGEKKEFKEGDTVEIEILRTGTWNHPVYGKFSVSKKGLSEMKKHFDENVRGVELAVDEDHDPQHKALAWYRELSIVNNGKTMKAKIELTQAGADHMNKGSYKYFSAEFATMYKDPESGKSYSNLLLGGAFTNRPFVKGMKPVQANEVVDVGATDKGLVDGQKPTFLLFSFSETMKKYFDQLHALEGKDTITKAEKEALIAEFNELSEEDQESVRETHNAMIKLSESETTDKDKEAGDKAKDKGEGGDTDTGDKGGDKGDKSKEGGDDKTVHKSHGDATKMSENVVINEKEGTVTIPLSEYKEGQKVLSETARSIRLSEAKEKANSLYLSENGDTMLTPKSVTALSEFAISLSQEQENKFWSVVKDMQAVVLGEMGMDVSTEENLDENGVKKFTESSQEVKFLLAEGLAANEEEAIEMATQHWKDKKAGNL